MYNIMCQDTLVRKRGIDQWMLVATGSVAKSVVFLWIGFAVVASRNEHRLNYYSIQYNDNRVQNKDYCYIETLLLLVSNQHNYTW